MQKGDAGDAVQRLQEALIEEGYLAREADGVFGSTTEKALRLYQRDQGLPVTGQADETMLTRLAETDAPREIALSRPRVSNDQVFSSIAPITGKPCSR